VLNKKQHLKGFITGEFAENILVLFNSLLVCVQVRDEKCFLLDRMEGARCSLRLNFVTWRGKLGELSEKDGLQGESNTKEEN
jgi:hypothetical protein